MTSSFVPQPENSASNILPNSLEPWDPGVIGYPNLRPKFPRQMSTTVLSISHQQRTIPPDRVQALINCPLPKTKRELLSILSLLNFFCIWIPNFSLITKLLYEATKGCLDELLFNPSSLANPLHQLTQRLLPVPIFHLPDHTRPFFLFAHSNLGQALGLLCQRARDTWAPIAYLSK